MDFGRPRGLQKSTKNRKKRFWKVFGTSDRFWERFGSDFGRFWMDFGWILEGFLEDFWSLLEGFKAQAMIRATKGKSMDIWKDGWNDGCMDEF